MPGWYLRQCRKGLSGTPMTAFSRIEDTKRERLHAFIKTASLLSDLWVAMGYALEEPTDHSEELRIRRGWHKPQLGIDGATAVEWVKNVHVRGKYLSWHLLHAVHITAVQMMHCMLKQALIPTMNWDVFKNKEHEHHSTMLSQFRKVSLRI